MTHWMCTTCGYYLQAQSPPKHCPGCKQTCAFNDVTCYRPECGGEQNIDPILVGATLKGVTGPAGEPHPRPAPAGVEVFPLVEVFNGLSREQVQKLRSLGHSETYEANSVICAEGAESRKLFLVEDGQVAVQSEAGGGVRVPITVVSKGGAFGWSALVPPYHLTASVMAASRTRVLAIEREALLGLMQSDPTLGLTIMQNVARIAASRLRNIELELTGLVERRG